MKKNKKPNANGAASIPPQIYFGQFVNVPDPGRNQKNTQTQTSALCTHTTHAHARNPVGSLGSEGLRTSHATLSLVPTVLDMSSPLACSVPSDRRLAVVETALSKHRKHCMSCTVRRRALYSPPRNKSSCAPAPLPVPARKKGLISSMKTRHPPGYF